MRRVLRSVIATLTGLLLGTAAGAQLYVWPRTPTNQDELVLEARTVLGCATLAPDGVQLVEPGRIRVAFDDGNRVICNKPNPCPILARLGSLPPGTYTLDFVPDRVSFASPMSTQFTIYASDLPSDSGYRGLRRRLPVDCLDGN